MRGTGELYTWDLAINIIEFPITCTTYPAFVAMTLTLSRDISQRPLHSVDVHEIWASVLYIVRTARVYLIKYYQL